MKTHDHDGDCHDLLMRMAQGVEGDLTPAERRALARHLAGCDKCGEFSESLRRTVQLCREAGAPTMSARAQARARANVARILRRAEPQRKQSARDALSRTGRGRTKRAGTR